MAHIALGNETKRKRENNIRIDYLSGRYILRIYPMHHPTMHYQGTHCKTELNRNSKLTIQYIINIANKKSENILRSRSEQHHTGLDKSTLDQTW